SFEKNLGSKGIAKWTKPNGGYFISLDVVEGHAKEVVEMAKEAGVKLTGAGATYPYKKDPKDTNIRIAPTYPSLSDLNKALEIVCVCIERAYLKKLKL
ncbi:MAG: aminotransferase, partial [Proteobacteria bacterium]|nr:aminotransferase [Pseudomonadota bacterium]